MEHRKELGKLQQKTTDINQILRNNIAFPNENQQVKKKNIT